MLSPLTGPIDGVLLIVVSDITIEVHVLKGGSVSSQVSLEGTSDWRVLLLKPWIGTTLYPLLPSLLNASLGVATNAPQIGVTLVERSLGNVTSISSTT